ncbi:NF-kappa-B inhibitor zeta-like [Colletes gigas]|uniref:NF-kappa-B inhibitor zeta-like n=1 Tax=Colletes gigas TaxID=935657 RepID=UPI001C9B887B|nr:NF-kappa-B inhibitor zeta-like [Colletes gigas]
MVEDDAPSSKGHREDSSKMAKSTSIHLPRLEKKAMPVYASNDPLVVRLSNDFEGIIEQIGSLRLTHDRETGKCEPVVDRETRETTDRPNFDGPAISISSEDDSEDEDKDEDDSGHCGRLVERGPMKPQFISTPRNQPYLPPDGLVHSWKTNQVSVSDYTLYNNNKELISRLDQLQNATRNVINSWNGRDRHASETDLASLRDPSEDTLLMIINRGAFQPAQNDSEDNFNLPEPPTEWQISPCNPIGSPQVHTANYRPPQVPSDSSNCSSSLHSFSPSSNQSYSDTPSPDNQVNEQLGEDLRSLTWNGDHLKSLIHSETNNTTNTVDTIDEWQLIEEFLRDLEKEEPEEKETQEESNASKSSNVLYPMQRNIPQPDAPQTSNPLEKKETREESNAPRSNNVLYPMQRNIPQPDAPQTSNPPFAGHHHPSSIMGANIVSPFERPQRERKPSSPQLRHILPWPSLNLPSTNASERLKEELDPKAVERAMSCLLKRSVSELAKQDEDGDTMLMCLVGHPEELAQKRAYLVPLVERLSMSPGALTVMNNRGEDALYLAALNCPEFSYVTGYLAATMLQKGIDISQRLYHIRGNSLIHAAAEQGDSHGEILAELLALKTVQGHAVFDLSRRNYDGKTALHVAVRSHNPAKGVICVATVKLLLKHGADPKITETKCGDTALHMAVSLNCDPVLVTVLLDTHDTDLVNMTNYNHNTALHQAATVSNSFSLEKQRDIFWQLVYAGGYTNVLNREGKTPLALVSPERKDAIRKIVYKRS